MSRDCSREARAKSRTARQWPSTARRPRGKARRQARPCRSASPRTTRTGPAWARRRKSFRRAGPVRTSSMGNPDDVKTSRKARRSHLIFRRRAGGGGVGRRRRSISVEPSVSVEPPGSCVHIRRAGPPHARRRDPEIPVRHVPPRRLSGLTDAPDAPCVSRQLRYKPGFVLRPGAERKGFSARLFAVFPCSRLRRFSSSDRRSKPGRDGKMFRRAFLRARRAPRRGRQKTTPRTARGSRRPRWQVFDARSGVRQPLVTARRRPDAAGRLCRRQRLYKNRERQNNGSL